MSAGEEFPKDNHQDCPGSDLVPITEAQEVTTEEFYFPYPSFEDFGGLDQQIEQLQRIGALLLRRDLAEQWDVDIPTGVLLCGPAGVGKTDLAKAFSFEIGAELFEVSVGDIQNMMYGESVQKLRKAFEQTAGLDRPSVLLFDELDGIFGKHAGGNNGVSNSLIAEMKNIMGKLRRTNPQTIVFGSTNSLSGFDPALLRPGRFDVILQIPQPNDAARASIFGKMITRRFDLYNLGDATGDQTRGVIDIQSLAAAAVGLSGADIKSVLHAARARRVYSHITRGTPLDRITQEDILFAITEFRHNRLHSAD